MDFNQANRDRTMAGAYSPRALPDATVSTPITWDELPGVDPHAFTVHTVQFERWRPDRDAASCGFDQLEVPTVYDLDDVLQ